MKATFAILLVIFMPAMMMGVTHEVTMVGLTFVPDTLNINQGDSVMWINTSAIFHTTTSGVNGVPNGYWDSGSMSPNDSFYFHFDSAGVFPYYCTPHWTLGMVGLITVEPLGIEEYKGALPVEFDVSQAYPNPSGGFVRVDYTLDVPGNVQVAVFNSAGQRVRDLADAGMPSGKYSAVWDGLDRNGNGVSAGAYFLYVSFNGRIQERKVLVLR